MEIFSMAEKKDREARSLDVREASFRARCSSLGLLSPAGAFDGIHTSTRS